MDRRHCITNTLPVGLELHWAGFFLFPHSGAWWETRLDVDLDIAEVGLFVVSSVCLIFRASRHLG